MNQILRSFLAVLAGFFATVILSTLTDLAMHGLGVFPPWGQPMSDGLFVLATVYRTIFTIAGGWITASVAPNKPVGHALVLGVIGMLAATAGTIVTWDKGPEYGPKWYPISLIVLAIPAVLLGAKLRSSAPMAQPDVNR